MDYSFLAARLSFTFIYTCIFFSWQINSAAAAAKKIVNADLSQTLTFEAKANAKAKVKGWTFEGKAEAKAKVNIWPRVVSSLRPGLENYSVSQKTGPLQLI